MEQYLRCYVDYRQDDWAKWLPIAEFAQNNHVSATTQLSPFAANYGYHPRGFPKAIEETRSSTNTLAAGQFAKRMVEIEEFLKENMLYAQQEQELQANRHRKGAPLYKPGDKVFVLTRHIKTSRPSNKLDYKKLGRYPIKRRINASAYEVDLPSSMGIHPVFHVSLLRPAPNDPVPGQSHDPPPPVEIDGEEEYEVEAIVDSRFNRRRKRLEYKVKWTGYDVPTWQPLEDLDNATEALQAYRLAYPRALG